MGVWSPQTPEPLGSHPIRLRAPSAGGALAFGKLAALAVAFLVDILLAPALPVLLTRLRKGPFPARANRPEE